MRKLFLLVLTVFLLHGCNMNPSKEARIQKLEYTVELTSEQFKSLELKIEELEKQNEQLQRRIRLLEE